MINKKIKNSGF